MQMTKASITLYKSIDDSGDVPFDPKVTVLVGQNESGKSAFLQALHKAAPISKGIAYDVTEDYPRKGLYEYEKQHANNPAVVATITYSLSQEEVDKINADLGTKLLDNLDFTRASEYSGGSTITLALSEKDYIAHLGQDARLSSDLKQEVLKYTNISSLLSFLKAADLNAEATTFLEELQEKFGKTPDSWCDLDHYVWSNFLSERLPRFLYFDDYYLLPGKVNLPDLQERIEASKKTGAPPLPSDSQTVVALLRMAGVDLNSLTDTSGYEKIKARLEAFSNSITDKVFQYWTQNPDLDVEFDIRTDPKDIAPFNNGNNLYIRIRNRRHRVSVPFSQRSKGFIWFFSFLVWFGSIQEEFGNDKSLILLLDEPGLSLHALAQADLLRYIDALAEDHQIIYTTHSPFMVQSDRLHQVRTVEDRIKEGTKVTDNISGSDPKTIFPLQAALGYTIAQNLFISKWNLLVEGPADLIYLKYFSGLLDKAGRTCLRDDVTIVPVGGLDNLATFVALLRGNELEMVVIHDYENKPHPRLEQLVRDKLIRDKQILNYALFRDADKKNATTATTLISSDVEDLLSPPLYLKLFNAAYTSEMSGAEIKEAHLPSGDRIVDRITRYLKDNAIQLRASGGFNHYLIANHLASNPLPISKVDAQTLARFERVFETVTGLYTSLNKVVP